MKKIKKLTHGSLFSGIGGFDLAAEWNGIENIFQVEIDKFCQKVLEKNFPNVTRYLDIKDFDGTKYTGQIDIISGGFPCQDLSISGKKKGLQGERSGLFYEMIRVVNAIQPKYVIFENSPQLLNYKTTFIQSFKEINYVTWFKKITARKFGFPHKRERLFGICFPNTNGNGFSALWDFNSKFEEIYKSEEIFRLSASNKAELNRAFGTSLRDVPNSDFLRSSHGLSKKLDTDRIKSLGNAIVPQIADMIFKGILEVTKNEKN